MARLTTDTPFLHPDCGVANAIFGQYIEIGRGSRVAHSQMDNYSCCGCHADIANASVGKFSNIAAFVRIGATDHPMDNASLHHFHYRSGDYFDDVSHNEDWFAHRRTRCAVTGHNTGLGSGAVVVGGNRHQRRAALHDCCGHFRGAIARAV